MNLLDGVAIAGGGAVGLTTALALARNQVPVTLFEAEPDMPQELRASTFHPPTVEMLVDLGIGHALIVQGLKADRYQYRDRKEGKIAEFDFSLLKHDTRFPFRLQLEQSALSKEALHALRQISHVDIKFGHRVTAMASVEGSVLIDVLTPHGPQKYKADWGVGADGSKSAVRKSLGIAFEGMTYPERYLSQFTTFELRDYLTDLALVNYVSDDEYWHVLLRSPGVWRVMFPTRPDETIFDEEVIPPEEFERIGQARLQLVVPTGKAFPVTQRRIYRVHQRVAASYRVGLVFLAGDAAHVNNPLGGMGLNGGVHDAVNLASKLSRVYHKQAPESLLDLYEKERRKVALDVVQRQTKDNERNISQRSPDARKQRNDELRRTAADPKLAHQFLLRNSMIESLRMSATPDD